MPEGPLAAALLESRVIAVVRVDESEAIIPTAHAIARGGVRLLEIALTSPGALVAISRLAAELPDALVGAGTVLNERAAEAVVEAGARFLFSPGFSADVLRVARARDVAYVPGALTPTEIMELLDLGIREIKIFPAGPAGPPYIRDLLGPFPELRAIPTGGVSGDNVRAFLRAGAVAVGVGGALTGERKDDYAGIERRTADLMALVSERHA